MEEHARREPGERTGTPLDASLVHSHSFLLVGISSIAALDSVMLGYDISIVSSVNAQLLDHLHLSLNQLQLETGLANFAGLPGALLAGPMADRLGRQKALLLNAATMFCGTVTMAMAPNFAIFCLGRIILGLAIGAALCLVPLYIAEVVPADSRGCFVSLCETFTNVGLLVGYCTGWALSELPVTYGWRVMLGLGVVPATAIALGVPMLPESPRWLALQGRSDEAEAVVNRLCASCGGGAEEAKAFMAEVQEAVVLTRSSSWADILCPNKALRPVLLLGIAVAVIQQTTGIEAAMYYTPQLLESAGVSSTASQLKFTIVLGVAKLFITLAASMCFDSVGRRPLAIAGTCLIAVSHGVVVLGFRYGISALVLAGQFAFIAFFAASLGPLCWVLVAELFPLGIRSHAAALATGLNRLTSSLIAFSFLSLSNAITPAGLFLCLLAVNLAAALFLYTWLPETKGKSLEKLEKELTRRQESAPSYGTC